MRCSDTTYYNEAASYDGAYAETNWGDAYTNEYRLIFQVALPSLASGAVVDSARFYQHVCYTSGAQTNSVVLDHLNWGAAYGVAEAFSGTPLQANIGTIASDTSIGWRSIPVTSSVQADYAAKRTVGQFRERYDYVTFPTTNNQYVEFGPQFCDQAETGQPFLVVWSH